jgi:hypothetical protein
MIWLTIFVREGSNELRMLARKNRGYAFLHGYSDEGSPSGMDAEPDSGDSHDPVSLAAGDEERLIHRRTRTRFGRI